MNSDLSQIEIIKYYLFLENKIYGPIDFETIKSLLKSRKITLGTYAYRDGIYNWEYLGELPEFDLRKKMAPPPPIPKIELPYINGSKTWMVFVIDGTVKGPLTTNDIKNLLLNKKMRRSSHVWTNGMRDWKTAMDVLEFYDECYPGNLPKIEEIQNAIAMNHFTPTKKNILSNFLKIFQKK